MGFCGVNVKPKFPGFPRDSYPDVIKKIRDYVQGRGGHRGRHGRQMILTCLSSSDGNLRVRVEGREREKKKRKKTSPSVKHGLGPLRASFIVRQVEQPLSAWIPPLSLTVILRLRKRFSPRSGERERERHFPRDLREPRNPPFVSRSVTRRNIKARLNAALCNIDRPFRGFAAQTALAGRPAPGSGGGNTGGGRALPETH